MLKGRCVSTAGVRLHQFVAGALPVVAYLLGWLPPIWLSLGLSILALASDRLILVAWLRRGKHSFDQEDPGPCRAIFRLDEVLRVILLGTGLGLLLKGFSGGWLLVLAAASIGLLEGSTAFSFILLIYTGLKLLFRGLYERTSAEDGAEATHPGNPNCLVCRTLRTAPYGRCRWCRLSSIRWCCGLQTSLLMGLLLVIAFLLNASLEPLMTKFLVTLSIMGLVGLSLAVSRQTDDLIRSLTHLDHAHRGAQKRCDFLKHLALAHSVQAAAEAAVASAAEMLGAGRVSIMTLDGAQLHIVASRGIPDEVAAQVAVPVTERICGRVFTSGTPVVFRDVASENPAIALGLNCGGALASCPLIVSMETAGRKVGVINVTDRTAGSFSDEDLAELRFIAEATAISLSSQLDRRDLERANYATIRSLALALEAKDPCTHGHSERVQVWASAVARKLGLSGPRLQVLTYAAELHDIGKIAIPDGILNAPRKLTPAEWAIVKEHPRRGAEMVRHLTFLRLAYDGILHHHERFDGAGYPDGLAGDEIPLEARILAVIDAYDAMTNVRPYRPAMAHDEAAEELRRAAGSQFDPQCVEAFLSFVGNSLAAPVGAEAWSADPP